MAARPARTAPEPDPLYDVCRAQDGALVVIGVDLDLARSEAARLNAEAKVPIRVSSGDPLHPRGDEPTAMWHGQLVVYEVRAQSGLAVAG